MKEKKVNLFVVGVNKCGTTTLHHILSSHKDIYMSKVKEPHFFSNKFLKGDCTNLEPIYRRYEDYIKLFDMRSNYIYYGESSTTYINFRETAKDIYDYNPNAKIIIMIRNPIDRAISQWKMDFANGWTKKNFLEAFWEDFARKDKTICNSSMYYEFGLYYEKILVYFDIFKSNVLVILQEELRNNSKQVLENLSKFLGVDNEFIIQSDYNVSGIPKNELYRVLFQNSCMRKFLGKILNDKIKNNIKKRILKKFDFVLPEDELEKLKELYIKDIEKLEKLLNKDLKAIWRI